MSTLLRRRIGVAIASLAAVGLVTSLSSAPAGAGAVPAVRHLDGVGDAGDESSELMNALSAYGDPRLSPAARAMLASSAADVARSTWAPVTWASPSSDDATATPPTATTAVSPTPAASSALRVLMC